MSKTKHPTKFILSSIESKKSNFDWSKTSSAGTVKPVPSSFYASIASEMPFHKTITIHRPNKNDVFDLFGVDKYLKYF